MNKRNLLVGAGLCVAVAGVAIAVKRARQISFRGRTVVITGGSRGLGLELARCWGREGATVIICARTDRDLLRALEELRGTGYRAYAFRCDVTEPAEVRRFIDGIIDRWRVIDVMVNNAGIIQTGPQQNMIMADYRDAMNTHFWAPLHFIDAVLPHMRRRRQGRIVNIASIGGEISIPHLLPYSASKFALVGLSQGLATELAGDGIFVTTVCPGLMRTGNARNAFFKSQHRKEYAWFSLGASIPGITVSSQKAARQIVKACRQGRPYLGISLAAKVATRLNAMFPTAFNKMLRGLNELLPDPALLDETNYRGKDSFSDWSPSPLTFLNEQAAAANNEVRKSIFSSQ